MVAFAGTALCQEFEVVAIKPSKSTRIGSYSDSDQGRFTGTNLSLKRLITTAYQLRDYQVQDPAWLDSVRFDITAKFPAALSKDPDKYDAALSAMMKKMLADRFKLAVHTDQKT
ncbi:MAG: TIGR03435 family protein [Terriglobia bacterium]